MSFKLGTLPRKNFAGDFALLLTQFRAKNHFAFSRFSDGEMHIMQNLAFKIGPGGHENYTHEDHKVFNPRLDIHQVARQQLIKAYLHQQDNYFCGLSCRCCVGQKNFEWMLQYSKKDVDMLTWANLLVNANYVTFIRKWLPLIGRRSVNLVCRENSILSTLPFNTARHFPITNDAMLKNIGLIDEMSQYIKQNNIKDQVFLLGAGSLSNILIHHLFTEYPNNTYIDIGSTLNPFMNLDIARAYLISGIQRLHLPITEKQKQSIDQCRQHGLNERVCIW